MKTFYILLLLLLPITIFAQFTISGKITDAETGETLVGATIYEQTERQGTSTNAYGFYSINVPVKKSSVIFSFVGYTAKTIAFNLSADTTISVQLTSHNVLEEITVSESRRHEILRGMAMGENRMTAREIETLPVVFGEVDIIKAIQSLPGVNAGSDGTAGFSVRGGSPDQTLILLDEVPVYNVNHLFGYFSIFNNDAIKDVTLVKGAIPSQYGGRLSSVLDVQMKEGNQFEHVGKASVSTLSGKYTLEGPIKKGKSSYMLSGRKTWLDLPLRLAFYLTDNDMKVLYSFYDLNGKANFQLSEKDRLFVSLYGGKDKFHLGVDGSSNFMSGGSSKFEFYWGNYTASGRWNHIYNSRLFSNLTVYYSNYNYHNRYDFKRENSEQIIDTYSSLSDFSLKYDFDYFLNNKHKIKFGSKLSYLFFQPETTEIDSTNTNLSSQYQAPIIDFYISDELTLGKNLSVNLGLRQSTLKRGSEYSFHFMPRVSARYALNQSSSVKAAYSHMVQHLHQLTNPSMSLPTTMWVLSNESLKSAQSNLSSIGYYYVHQSGLELSTEAYYSTMKNVIDYQPGKENFKINQEEWNESVMTGVGRSYGAELFIKHRIGKYSGQFSYTWSRSFRKYDALEHVGYYPYVYDRPHNLSFQLTKRFDSKPEAKFNKRLSLNFNYMSGHMISFSNYTVPAILPSELDGYDHNIADFNYYIPNPNNVRLPAVHHLDLAFHLEHKSKEKSSWIFSVYNIYNRKNISFYYIDWKDQMKGATLLPIIPSVTWNYKF
ncbi:MAG: TonB-dependent receptor [Prolixibacteraceae bacterium]|jgi:outer membrane receptor for ferrienterochelin and colicin|nr:TonB-dependent receptor [Prolixibacteraceae bacterium]